MDMNKELTHIAVAKVGNNERGGGLHASPSGALVALASIFSSRITLSDQDAPELSVNMKSILGVMMLAAERGKMVKIQATGVDSELAIEALKQAVETETSHDIHLIRQEYQRILLSSSLH
jgi:phosphocarrier protein HPr